jgi:hypothetical protein
MPENNKSLGNLRGIYPTSPVYLQRAAIIAVVSFMFFLAMLLAFSLRQNIGYFLLATAFLIVQLFTLFGWIMQRKNELKMYENGFTHRKKTCLWDEIKTLKVKTKNSAKTGCEIVKTNGGKIVLTEAISNIGQVVNQIQMEFSRKK